MKESFYFSHDYNSQSDSKIENMIFSLGWESYGLYWALIEKLAQETTHKMRTQYDRISFVLRCEKITINSIVEDFELFEFDDSFFWSKRLLCHFNERELKSNKARDSANRRWHNVEINEKYPVKNANASKKNANASSKKCERNAIKERKGKESKEKKNKYSLEFEKFWDLYAKKIDLKKCERIFERLSKAKIKDIFETLPAYIESTPDIQFRKNPSTYLNQESWNDVIPEFKTSGQSKVDAEDAENQRKYKLGLI